MPDLEFLRWRKSDISDLRRSMLSPQDLGFPTLFMSQTPHLSSGLAWLHMGCWTVSCADKKAEAVAASADHIL